MCTMLERNSISNKKQETTEIIKYYKQRDCGVKAQWMVL